MIRDEFVDGAAFRHLEDRSVGAVAEEKGAGLPIKELTNDAQTDDVAQEEEVTASPQDWEFRETFNTLIRTQENDANLLCPIDSPHDDRAVFQSRTHGIAAPGSLGRQQSFHFENLTPITLRFDDADVRKALEMLSSEASLNLLVSPNVTGRVTASFENVAIEEALDAVLKLCGLTACRERNFILVYTLEEFARLKDRERKVITRVYHLNYLRASDLQQMITPFLSQGVGQVSITPVSDQGIASDRDKVGGDSLAGGEALIVQDFDSVIQRIDNIVQRLDVRPRQVVIEAVILEAQLDRNSDLGVNFAFLDHTGNAVAVAGEGAAINAAAGFQPAALVTAAGKLVDGLANKDHEVKIGFVDKNVTGFIRALKQCVDVNVLASPRVMVLNKQRAELIIGERIGFKTTTVTETAAVEKVEYLNVGTQLRLRPFVADDGMIRMEIHPERSTGQVVDGIPQTRTSEVTTNVIVPNGATIVIAGLIEDDGGSDIRHIAGLSDLPIIGKLFRRKIHSNTKREVIVLLTPRLWDLSEGYPLRQGEELLDFSARAPDNRWP